MSDVNSTPTDPADAIEALRAWFICGSPRCGGVRCDDADCAFAHKGIDAIRGLSEEVSQLRAAGDALYRAAPFPGASRVSMDAQAAWRTARERRV